MSTDRPKMSDGVSNGDAPSKTTNGGGGGGGGIPPPRDEPHLEPVNGIVNPPTEPPANRPGRVTNQLQFLKNNVMKAMWKHQYGWPFHKPVDTIQFGLQDYFKIVRKPMDLGKHFPCLPDRRKDVHTDSKGCPPSDKSKGGQRGGKIDGHFLFPEFGLLSHFTV